MVSKKKSAEVFKQSGAYSGRSHRSMLDEDKAVEEKRNAEIARRANEYALKNKDRIEVKKKPKPEEAKEDGENKEGTDFPSETEIGSKRR